MSSINITAAGDATASSRAHVGVAIERMTALLATKPGLARKPSASATAVLGRGLQCLTTGPAGEQVATDMPPAIGGESAGPNPGWLLRASLASCMATTMAVRAAATGIAVERLEVSVHSESDFRGILGIDDVPAAFLTLRLEVCVSAPTATRQQLDELVV